MSVSLFKEAAMILSDGFIQHDDAFDFTGLFAIAKRHGLPVQVTAWDPGSVARIRRSITNAGVAAIVTGLVSMPERSDDLDEDAAELVAAGVDMLHSHVPGSFAEVETVAMAMARTGMPFSVSAKIYTDDGRIPGYQHQDGRKDESVPLVEAIARLDANPQARPWHYMLSCIDPRIADRVLETTFRAVPQLAHRIIGVNGNAEGSSPSGFALEMKELAERFGLNVIGGCCGMDAERFESLASSLTS